MGCICAALSSWMGCSFGESSGTKTTITSYKERYCTDLPCLALFVAVIAAIVTFIWLPAFKSGDYTFDYPKKILLPHDYQMNLCGVGKLSGKPYAYWPVVDQNIWRNKHFMLCTNTCTVTMDSTKVGEWKYPSKARLGFCVPHCDLTSEQRANGSQCIIDRDPQGLITPSIKVQINKIANNNFMDIGRAKWIIAISVILALILCFLFIFAMKLFAAPIVYCCILLIIAALAGLSYALFVYSHSLNVKFFIFHFFMIHLQTVACLKTGRTRSKMENFPQSQ